MDLAETSTGTLAKMETMVSKMLDVKLSGIRASIDELARQTQVAESERRVLEQKISAQEENWENKMFLVIRAAIKEFNDDQTARDRTSQGYRAQDDDERMDERQSTDANQHF